jgi:hypothetical protein
MNAELPSHFPADVLEQRAAEQRRRLHNSVTDLRSSLTELKTDVEQKVRERLDPNRVARQHLWPIAVGVSLIALLAGHGIAGMFTRN